MVYDLCMYSAFCCFVCCSVAFGSGIQHKHLSLGNGFEALSVSGLKKNNWHKIWKISPALKWCILSLSELKRISSWWERHIVFNTHRFLNVCILRCVRRAGWFWSSPSMIWWGSRRGTSTSDSIGNLSHGAFSPCMWVWYHHLRSHGLVAGVCLVYQL